MNTTPNTSTPNPGDATLRARSGFSRPAALIGGATALVALTAIATTLALKVGAVQTGQAGSSTTRAHCMRPCAAATATPASSTPGTA